MYVAVRSLSSGGTRVEDLQVGESLQALGDTVSHAFRFLLGDHGGLKVFEAWTHAFGCGVDLKLGAEVLHRKDSGLILCLELVGSGHELGVVAVLLLEEISDNRHYFFYCNYYT